MVLRKSCVPHQKCLHCGPPNKCPVSVVLTTCSITLMDPSLINVLTAVQRLRSQCTYMPVLTLHTTRVCVRNTNIQRFRRQTGIMVCCNATNWSILIFYLLSYANISTIVTLLSRWNLSAATDPPSILHWHKWSTNLAFGTLCWKGTAFLAYCTASAPLTLHVVTFVNMQITEAMDLSFNSSKSSTGSGWYSPLWPDKIIEPWLMHCLYQHHCSYTIKNRCITMDLLIVRIGIIVIVQIHSYLC